MTNASGSIAHLKVTLRHVEPAVTRRLEVPLDIRLDRLHLILQAALGWTDSHLWEIRARDAGWGIPDPDWADDGPLDAHTATLWDVLEDTGVKTLHYLYDFGDGWEHTIKILRVSEADPSTQYPILREASGCCPPEDIGGPWGYEEFLEAIAAPDHERHEELIEWGPENFDPQTAPVEDLKAAVAALAKAWSNRTPRKRKRQ